MQWNPLVLPNVMALGVSLALLLHASRRSRSPAKAPFLCVMTIIAAWNLVYGLSLVVTEPAVKFYLMDLRMVPPSFVGVTTLVFVSALVGDPLVLNWRRILLLFSIPAVTTVLAFAGDPNDWLFTSLTLREDSPLVFWSYGPWMKVQIVHGWMTFVAAMTLLGLSTTRAEAPYRQQHLLVFLMALPPAVMDLLHASKLSPVPGYNFAPAALALSGLGFAYIMQRYGLIDLSPVARRVVVDRMLNAMLVTDAEHRLVDLNEAAEKLLAFDRSRIGASVAKALAGHAPLVSLLTGAQAEGSAEVTIQERVFDASLSSLTLNDRAIGRVLVLHDVTERKQREDQIRQQAREVEELSRVRDAFVTTVSHELRTPLNVIVGATELLKEEPLTPEAQGRVEMIHDAGELLIALVNDVLSLAKLRAGKLALEAIPFAPAPLLQRSMGLFEVTCQQKGLALTCSVPADLPTLQGDPVRVQQIVVNLLGNAVKFTRQGEVRLDAVYREGHLELTVSDTGPGIPPEKKASIFEAFAQIDASTTRRFGGTGLGLSIVHGLVGSMGGTIAVADHSPRGTVFTVRLPIPVAAAEAVSTTPISREDLRAVMTSSGAHAILPSSPRPERTTPLRVLIVDDVYENRLLFEAMLRKESIDLTLAEDGRSALERFRGAEYDVVLLDIEMPDLDGYAVVQHMRSWERSQARAPVFIAALTTHGTPEHRDRAMAAGFSAHLTKPVRKRDLLKLLAR